MGLPVRLGTFQCTLHWPTPVADLGEGGASYAELFFLYELEAEERFVLQKAFPRYRRPGRPISVSAVPRGPGIDMWLSCRVIGCLLRAMCALPGGPGRCLPCGIGAHHCRLRHIWMGEVWAWAHVPAQGDLFVPFLNDQVSRVRHKL